MQSHRNEWKGVNMISAIHNFIYLFFIHFWMRLRSTTTTNTQEKKRMKQKSRKKWKVPASEIDTRQWVCVCGCVPMVFFSATLLNNSLIYWFSIFIYFKRIFRSPKCGKKKSGEFTYFARCSTEMERLSHSDLIFYRILLFFRAFFGFWFCFFCGGGGWNRWKESGISEKLPLPMNK